MKYLRAPAHQALNAVCPYFTMFPLDFPERRLRKERAADRSPVVLDVFCGRGTTLFAARSMGLRSFGIDSSPVAVAIARAKLASTSLESVLSLADRILRTKRDVEMPAGEFWKRAYHPSTLQDMVRLRAGLRDGRDTDAARVLTAISLGALHGPLPKDVSNAAYFSNQMPRTYASKPTYSVRFWKKRGLRPPRIDVPSVLKRRAERIFQSGVPARSPGSKVILGDSRDPRIFDALESVDMVITSPPYFGMRTYIPDQWLRNWFLGGPPAVDYDASKQIGTGDPESFAQALAEAWNNVSAVGSPQLKVVVRFGGISSRRADPHDLLKDSFRLSRTAWKLVSHRAVGSIRPGRRQAEQMQVSDDAVEEFDTTWVRA